MNFHMLTGSYIPPMKSPEFQNHILKKMDWLPFILNRLLINKREIEDNGHKIYFSVSRGPLNIASYLMGTTEFLTAMITHPAEIHHLLQLITDYLVDIHDIQKQAIPTIDGLLILDDIIGFIGENEFVEFGIPYFQETF